MFKKILAPVRGTREDAAALDVGFLLARRFGARVEAFYAAPSSTPSVTVESKPSDEVARLEGTELYRTARALFAERLERITSIVPQSSGLSARFSALPGPEADLIAAIGRVSDLIIIAHPAEDGSPWPNLSLESAIRETGCPVLLVPRAVSRIGARVAIAWNGTPEVARAVRFALPLLRETEQTLVVTVGKQPYKSTSAAELVEYLRCHGVKGESVMLPLQHGSESMVLLGECLARQADLIVAGAFTRYRTERPTFGSMTQAMIMQTQMQVFMAQ
jgi:nucleotide-binding universal stress UspA family protein